MIKLILIFKNIELIPPVFFIMIIYHGKYKHMEHCCI